jgi:hypothetical protein
MKITKSILPVHSLAHHYLPADYADVFGTDVPGNERLTPDNLLITFWTDFPEWVQMLFKLRDRLVRPFGLKAGAKDEDFRHRLEEAVRSSGRFHLMTVLAKSANETLVQLADRHLTAIMSFHQEKSAGNRLIIHIATIVHYHNVGGKVYFFFVRPFHKLIFRTMMKRSIRKLSGL